MHSKSLISLLTIFILALLVSACGPETTLDVEEVLDPEVVDISERNQFAGEGSADVYYHYHVQVEDLKFKIDMPFAINFAETDQVGSFDAQGIYQDLVSFTMAAAGGESGRCEIHCTVNLKFVATGAIKMGENGECEIPMNFSFVPQGDYLMDTTCPPETHDVVDCNALSMVMMDPTTYTFLGSDTELYVPSENGVKREAEIKNLVFPEDMKGTCTWTR